MRRQNTCQNLSGNYQKRMKTIIQKEKLIKQKNSKYRRTISSSNILLKDLICKEHHLNFEKYCLDCKEDICPKCYKDGHLIHETIKYNELFLNESQMALFKEKYNAYIDKYYELIKKIKEWQNILNRNIKDLEEFMELNIINMIKKMINEYNNKNLKYNTIIEYRMAFSLLLENNEDKLNNQKIIKLMKTHRSLNNYDEYKYINENQNLSNISLNTLQHYNDLINKGNFENKGNNIIKFLFNNISLYSKKNEDNIIKKLEEIKQRNNKIIKFKKLNKSTNNLFQKTSNNFNKILLSKDNNIYEKKKVADKKRNVETHLEKEELPIFGPFQTQLDDDIQDNININSIINEKNNPKKKEKSNEYKNIWKNKNFFNKEDSGDNFDEFDDLDLDLNYNTENNKINRRPIIFNNNINNFNSINNISNKNNYISNYNIEKAYSDRSHKSKVYTHKKFNSTLTGFNSCKNINFLNQSQSDTDGEKIKEGDYNTINFNNYNFEEYSNTISNNNKNNLTNKIFPKEENNIEIIKVIEIDPDKDINIGFELGNSECRIGLINKYLNKIEIWSPYDDINEINIPTIISFKDRNDNILIGKQAEDERINNPNYTIFNFVKLIGKNWDEIQGMKEFWGFKLYNN